MGTKYDKTRKRKKKTESRNQTPGMFVFQQMEVETGTERR